jgi:hypothetical protein
VTAVAATVEAFFTDRLLSQRQASPHTIAAYRDTSWRTSCSSRESACAGGMSRSLTGTVLPSAVITSVIRCLSLIRSHTVVFTVPLEEVRLQTRSSKGGRRGLEPRTEGLKGGDAPSSTGPPCSLHNQP